MFKVILDKVLREEKQAGIDANSQVTTTAKPPQILFLAP